MELQKKNKSEENSLRRIPTKELKAHPEITIAFQKNKTIKFELLNFLKPKSISTRNIKNEKKKKFVESLNSFRNIFYDFSNIKKKSLNDIKKLKRENFLFEKNYKEYIKKNSFDYSDLKIEYEKKNFFFPKLPKENLFKKNILFLNKSNIDNSIKYGLSNKNHQKKTIKFLTKIQNQIELLKLKESNLSHSSNIINLYIKKVNSVPCMKIKDINKSLKEIEKNQKEISNIKQTFEHIFDLDNFFDNNKPLSSVNNYSKKNLSQELTPKINKNKINLIHKIELRKKILKKSQIETIRKDKLNENDCNKVKKFIKLFPSNLIKGNLNKATRNKLNLLFHHPIEKLYNEVSKEIKPLKYNEKIKSYLKNRGIKCNNDISVQSILNQFKKSKNKILKNNLKKNFQFINKFSHENTEEFSKEQLKKIKMDNDINIKMNKSQNQIINLFCSIDNN